MPTQKESIQKLVELMKEWQTIEDAAIKNTSEILKKTDNPLFKIIMQVIHQDSVMHKRVQQLIIDNFELGFISIKPHELEEFWDMLEEHEEIEKKTIELAEASLNETTSQLAKFLLTYLLTDERKHDMLMNEFEKIKKGKYPHGRVENI
ncbi:MAG: hypothetical protein ABSG15_14450 [FCB group bacterium]|jgi:aminopeptidase C